MRIELRWDMRVHSLEMPHAPRIDEMFTFDPWEIGPPEDPTKGYPKFKLHLRVDDVVYRLEHEKIFAIVTCHGVM